MRRLSAAAWWAAVATLLGATALVLAPKVSWYLSVDQFGYLTFARDLFAGHVFHRWPPAEALAGALPARTDVLSQTYIYDHGRLHCRYAPGYPLLLAGWMHLFGVDAAHTLNLTLFLTLLVLYVALARRLFAAPWPAAGALALTVLSPTSISVWALTVSRDIPAHLSALGGLFLLVPPGGARTRAARVAAAGLALGFAVSIRPDSALYLVPALLLVWRGWRTRVWRRSALPALALGMAVGLMPVLAYDMAVSGNPLRTTQGMELEQFFTPRTPRPPPAPSPPPAPDEPAAAPPAFPTTGWHGGTEAQVQGSGLRLAYLPTTLPGNLELLAAAHGVLLLLLAIAGAVVAGVVRPALLLLAVPYSLVALFFFSCWGRPDVRYMAGIHLMIPLLAVQGVIGAPELARLLSRRGWPGSARTLAAVGATILAVAWLGRGAEPMAPVVTLTALVPGLAVLGAVAALAWPQRDVAAVVAAVLALALVSLTVISAGPALAVRAPFRRAEMLSARSSLAQLVEPHAVVITSEDIGRPAENIEYHSGVAHALYLTDLVRWGLSVRVAALRLLQAGLRPYLLLPPDSEQHRQLMRELQGLAVTRAATAAPEQAIDYFVLSRFHQGVPLALDRIDLPPGANATDLLR